MEHLAMPKASVWHLVILRYLCTWPEFIHVELAQGLWGAVSPKPTGLLLLNLPRRQGFFVASSLPTAKAIGRNEDGSWRTPQLKEYPPALCAGLAEGFFDAVNQHEIDSSLTVDCDFRRQALKLTISAYGASISPDFAGHS